MVFIMIMEFGNLIYKIRVYISDILYTMIEWVDPYEDLGTLGRPDEDNARSGEYKISGREYEDEQSID